jgi:phage-related protein
MTQIGAPTGHVEDALKLTSDKEVDLFTITLRDNSSVFRLRNGPEITWRTNTFENIPIMLGGEEDTSDERVARPTMRIFNPGKVFGPFAQAGLFELAHVVRQTVLQQNLIANANIFVQRVWIIGRITHCTSEALQVELRAPTDGPNMQVPFRMYAPPEFPYVSY